MVVCEGNERTGDVIKLHCFQRSSIDIVIIAVSFGVCLCVCLFVCRLSPSIDELILLRRKQPKRDGVRLELRTPEPRVHVQR